MLIERAAHMFEAHTADPVREQARLRIERLQAGVPDLVIPEHLLDEQQRVGADEHGTMAVGVRPFESRNERAVFGDVVRRDADRFAEFFDQPAVWPLDPHAEPGGTGIAARAAIYVRDDVVRRSGGAEVRRGAHRAED